MAVPPHHFDDEPADIRPGGLLGELERRQDDVLSQLDDLDAKLSEVLGGLEPVCSNQDGSETSESEPTPFKTPEAVPESGCEEARFDDANDVFDEDDGECAEDWA